MRSIAMLMVQTSDLKRKKPHECTRPHGGYICGRLTLKVDPPV